MNQKTFNTVAIVVMVVMGLLVVTFLWLWIAAVHRKKSEGRPKCWSDRQVSMTAEVIEDSLKSDPNAPAGCSASEKERIAKCAAERLAESTDFYEVARMTAETQSAMQQAVAKCYKASTTCRHEKVDNTKLQQWVHEGVPDAARVA